VSTYNRVVAADETTFSLAPAVRTQLAAELADSTSEVGGALVALAQHVSVRDYGVTSDGTTDDTTNFQAAWNAAATAGLPLILEPNTTVMVDAITIPDGGRLNLNGSTIKKTAATGTAMLTGLTVSDIEIWGGTLDGDKASYAATTEWRHGIDLRDCANINLHNLSSTLNKGDGIYIGASGTAHCSNVTLTNVTCPANHRNGMSVTAVSGLTATACLFESSSGTRPMSGVDIEPNAGNILCENITLMSCVFADNVNYGFLAAFPAAPTVHQGNINLIGCTSKNNGTDATAYINGVMLTGVDDFTMVGGSVSGSGGSGIVTGAGACSRVNITNVDIRDNAKAGIQLTSPTVGLNVAGCTFTNNGTEAANAYSAVIFQTGAGTADIIFSGNRVEATTHQYGLRTNSGVTKLTLIGNTWAGMTAPTYLFDTISTRTELDGGLFLRPHWAISTAGRPTAASVGRPSQVYDTTLNKPIWSDGTNWRDAAGTIV